MAALVGRGGGAAAGAATKGASTAAAAVAAGAGAKGIDFEAEAQSRGMRLVSCTKVGTERCTAREAKV